jgi:hypothetical protein
LLKVKCGLKIKNLEKGSDLFYRSTFFISSLLLILLLVLLWLLPWLFAFGIGIKYNEMTQ